MSDDADAANSGADSEANYGVSDDNDNESDTNNPYNGDPDDTGAQHNPAFLSGVSQCCLA